MALRLWKSFLRIFRPKSPYPDLRAQVLALKPEQLNLPGARLLALLMETGYEKAVVSLVAVADGTVSLYFSNGGGMIGLGAHEGPREAGRKLLALAAGFLDSFKPIARPATPVPGMAQFVAVTPGGTLLAAGRETDLGNNRHLLSPIFHAAHEVITQIRLHSEKKP